MPINDSWTAATAIANDLAVASQDGDEDEVRRLRVLRVRSAFEPMGMNRAFTHGETRRRIEAEAGAPAPGCATARSPTPGTTRRSTRSVLRAGSNTAIWWTLEDSMRTILCS
ncbi:MAG: hypothetical protein M0040_10115 [Actinomycetota bacterium]|nr:hypothetical protein [Actinomycetota bacterium]